MLAAPPGVSPLAASFVGTKPQGIHPAPSPLVFFHNAFAFAMLSQCFRLSRHCSRKPPAAASRLLRNRLLLHSSYGCIRLTAAFVLLAQCRSILLFRSYSPLPVARTTLLVRRNPDRRTPSWLEGPPPEGNAVVAGSRRTKLPVAPLVSEGYPPREDAGRAGETRVLLLPSAVVKVRSSLTRPYDL